MKNKIFKFTTTMLACATVFGIGVHCYNNRVLAENNINMIQEEPIIFTEVSNYDYLYDFSDSKVLAEHSDLIVIGKITNLDEATNFNPAKKKYTKTTTPGELEVIKVLKANTTEKLDTVKFMDIGGTVSYLDYEKSLLPAQKAKRDYLMQQNGEAKIAKTNMFVKQEVKNQLELEEDKTYIMYLYYN